MQPPSVYDYLDYRAFLRAWLSHRRAVDPGFSFATFARRAGLSRSALPNVLTQGRTPRPKTVDAFARAMDLDPHERNFFELLVALEQADGPTHRRAVLDTMINRRAYGLSERMESRPTDFERYASRWYHAAIRELARTPGFRPDPAWIAEVLRPRIAVHEAEQALHLLQQLGLIEIDGDRARVTSVRIDSNDETTARASLRFHAETVPELAARAAEVPPEARHLVGGVLLLSADGLAEAKLVLAAAARKLAALSDDPTAPDGRPYHFAAQLLPLTDDPTGGSRSG